MRSTVTQQKPRQGRLPLQHARNNLRRKPNIPALAREDMRWMLETLLLTMIEHHGTAYGYQLAQGVFHYDLPLIGFAESSVYRSLARFVAKGWVESFYEYDEYHEARYYALTDSGRLRAATRRVQLGQAAMYALQALELPFTFQENTQRALRMPDERERTMR